MPTNKPGKITRKTYIEALNRVSATDDGKIVLAAIKDACKWDITYLATDNIEKTYAYAVVRGVYGSIRRDIDHKHLKSIEYDYQFDLTPEQDE